MMTGIGSDLVKLWKVIVIKINKVVVAAEVTTLITKVVAGSKAGVVSKVEMAVVVEADLRAGAGEVEEEITVGAAINRMYCKTAKHEQHRLFNKKLVNDKIIGNQADDHLYIMC
jgi:hypothetical protein